MVLQPELKQRSIRACAWKIHATWDFSFQTAPAAFCAYTGIDQYQVPLAGRAGIFCPDLSRQKGTHPGILCYLGVLLFGMGYKALF